MVVFEDNEPADISRKLYIYNPVSPLGLQTG